VYNNDRGRRPRIADEPQVHPVLDWLAFRARTAAAQDVAGRLEQSGYLAGVTSQRGWRARQWVPADAQSAFAPVLRVKSVLDPSRPSITFQPAAPNG
jgi:hypothetical protein